MERDKTLAADTLREAVAIAARLSPAQRRALMWLQDEGQWRSLPVRSRLRVSLWALGDRGLSVTGKGWQATPLGLRVRAVIAAQPPEAAAP